MKYFAYGSNMSINRMLQRKVKFTKTQKATLDGYEFVINKVSQKDRRIGFANIKANESDFVEGVLYDIDDTIQLDKYEGYPVHYNKLVLPVATKDGIFGAVVYIANKSWISDGLICTEEYRDLILEGKEYLSDEYYGKICEITNTPRI